MNTLNDDSYGCDTNALEINSPEVKTYITELKSDLKSLPGSDCSKSFSKLPPHILTLGNLTPNIKETKNIMDTFSKHLNEYPKHISAQGSTMLCAELAVDNTIIWVKSLPEDDQMIIKSMCNSELYDWSKFTIQFDLIKDFILTFASIKACTPGYVIKIFNTLIHPKLSPPKNKGIAVNTVGENISIDGYTLNNKKRIQELAGIDEKDSSSKTIKPQIKSQVSNNRNAFEIRTDVLQMSLDFFIQKGSVMISDDDVINVAKKFYKFVENK